MIAGDTLFLGKYFDIGGRVDRHTVSTLALRVTLCHLGHFDDGWYPLSLDYASWLRQSSLSLQSDINLRSSASPLTNTPPVRENLVSPCTRTFALGHLHDERLPSSAITSGIYSFNAGGVLSGRSQDIGSRISLQIKLLDDFLLGTKETQSQEAKLGREEL